MEGSFECLSRGLGLSPVTRNQSDRRVVSRENAQGSERRALGQTSGHTYIYVIRTPLGGSALIAVHSQHTK